MNHDTRIYIAGHSGLVGSAIVRALHAKGFRNLIVRKREELDLRRQPDVEEFFSSEKPDYVFVAAARVGGIHANARLQGEFLYDNLMISTNVIAASRQSGVHKLLYLGSSCLYPNNAPQPFGEASILTGPLEPTNEGYAIAKLAAMKLCEKISLETEKKFISVIPANLYGPGDNFNPEYSHVIPGLMRRFHEAKVKNQSAVQIWGSGKARREFLHVDDAATALVMLMQEYNEPTPINLGSGQEISIGELAQKIASVVGFQGRLDFDTSKPDGAPLRILDSRKIAQFNWRPIIQFERGLAEMYSWAIEKNCFP